MTAKGGHLDLGTHGDNLGRLETKEAVGAASSQNDKSLTSRFNAAESAIRLSTVTGLREKYEQYSDKEDPNAKATLKLLRRAEAAAKFHAKYLLLVENNDPQAAEAWTMYRKWFHVVMN